MIEMFIPLRKKAESRGYLLLGLTAIELFMSFSFLGYLHIEPISITFVYIPVLIAGCVFGPKEGALLGAVFGFASMWKASAFYVGAGDTIFSPVMSGKPLESFVLSVVTRTLFGFFTGLLYKAAQKSRHPQAGIALVTSCGRTIHAFFVYACMGIVFPETGFSGANAVDDLLRWDFVPFLLIANLAVFCCYRFSRSGYIKRLNERIAAVNQANAAFAHSRRNALVILVLMLAASFSVALYFTDRIESVMASHEISLNESISYDIMHLQIQFLLGILSLAFLVMIVALLYQKNMNYLYYEARMDDLTGLLGREQFFQTGAGILKDMKAPHGGKTGCFLILDIDHFKEINDRNGHPAGDRVLKRLAENLKELFENRGILGRLGGDEFVALIYHPMAKTEIEKLLNQLKQEMAEGEGEAATCSIGVIPVEPGYTIEELYRSADRLLYEAKKQGKNQFVFGYRFEDEKEKTGRAKT